MPQVGQVAVRKHGKNVNFCNSVGKKSEQYLNSIAEKMP